MKHRIIFSLMMSFILSFLMTLWVTYLNLGLGANFVNSWLHAFVLAWPAAAIISFVASPLALRLTNLLLK